jgi:hypothetical protein
MQRISRIFFAITISLSLLVSFPVRAEAVGSTSEPSRASTVPVEANSTLNPSEYTPPPIQEERGAVPPIESSPQTPEPTVQPTVVPPITPSPDAKVFVPGTVNWFGRYLGLSDTDPRLIAANLIRTALSFLGIIFLVMIILAGFTFMTSGGNEERSASARRTFFNAIIGLIIILCSFSIVRYVTGAFTAATGAAPVTSPTDLPAPQTTPATPPSQL